MSKIVKAVTQPGLGDPLGISGGGGKKKKGPESLKGKGREQFVAEATSRGVRHFMPEKETWADYVKSTQAALNKPAPQPAPAPFSMPSITINYPEFPTAPRAPKAQTTAERLQAEAEDVAKAEGRETVASRAQGLSTRLRVAAAPKRAIASEEEEDAVGAGGDSLGLPTLLGSRGTGGQTSYRRKRISRY